MDVLQESLNQALAKLPALLLEEVIARKLKEQGIAGKGLSRKLADHVLSGKREPLNFRTSKHTGTVTLDFNQTDADEITQAADKFCEIQLPKLLVNIAAKTSKKILKDLKSRWATENSLQNKDISEFRKRLEERWDGPLGQLRMLLTVAREWFEGRHKREISQPAHVDKEFREITGMQRGLRKKRSDRERRNSLCRPSRAYFVFTLPTLAASHTLASVWAQ
jgi:hypothetical protein